MTSLGGFETESDIEKRRQKRQEEWEKVRTADQPEDAPEEPYDGRSLYERLKEQRDAKDLEFEESRKFKNMVSRLSEDEVDHLSEIENKKLDEEKKTRQEELKELQDYRAKVAELQEQSAEQKLANVVSIKPKQKDSSSRTSQKSILSAVVKRKSDVQTSNEEPPAKIQHVTRPSALQVFAVLPGIGNYKSSDDESDSSSEVESESSSLQRIIRTKKEKEEC